MDTAEVAASLRARSRPPSRGIGDPRRLVTTTTTTLINRGRVTGQRHREPFAIHVADTEGIQLPATLALLLRADLIGPCERPLEPRRDVRLACDLAADVADDATKPAAQDAQLATVALELFGVGIAPRHHGGALGDAQIGLPQSHDRRLSPLIAACKSLASVGNVMALGCTVVSTVTRARSLVCNAPVSCAILKLSANNSSSLSPSRLRQWLRSERSCGKTCWKNSAPVKYWK